ncbi:MAG: hypothetical protein B6226_01795 [Candidatus Cloacimonetes bacterium 4572_65]|nr:MAG: hypothetical protein B6226_01795 [Candidatus Cloacimonetes bacterium 4572_65]
MANTIKGYITSIINDFSKEELTPYAKNPFEIAIRMLYNPELKSVYMFIPGLMAFILTLISAFMTSITLTKEKELGNMEILLISPLKPYQIIVGKVIPYAILSIFNIGTILGFGKYLFNMPFNGSILLLWAESILFLFSALALGIMISSFTSSRQVAMMASLSGLLLPTLLLSGFIFPIANMPNVLQYFTYIVPAKYFITIIKSIMIKGNGFEYIISETLALAGFTLLFVLISIKKFNVRLDK